MCICCLLGIADALVEAARINELDIKGRTTAMQDHDFC